MSSLQQARASAPPTEDAPQGHGGAGIRSLVPGLILSFLVAAGAYGIQQVVPVLSSLLVGIVLLGLQLDIRDIVALGLPMVLAAMVIVAGGMFGTLAIGTSLSVPPMQRLLIAYGFSICGAAAVAGIEGPADAEEEDVATAIGLVVLFGTLMIGIAPLVLAGIIGGGALGVAVIVKLTRVLMLALFLAAVMFALGTGAKYSLLTKVGLKPVVLGACSTALVGGLALTGAVLVG